MEFGGVDLKMVKFQMESGALITNINLFVVNL